MYIFTYAYTHGITWEIIQSNIFSLWLLRNGFFCLAFDPWTAEVLCRFWSSLSLLVSSLSTWWQSSSLMQSWQMTRWWNTKRPRSSTSLKSVVPSKTQMHQQRWIGHRGVLPGVSRARGVCAANEHLKLRVVTSESVQSCVESHPHHVITAKNPWKMAIFGGRGSQKCQQLVQRCPNCRWACPFLSGGTSVLLKTFSTSMFIYCI